MAAFVAKPLLDAGDDVPNPLKPVAPSENALPVVFAVVLNTEPVSVDDDGVVPNSDPTDEEVEGLADSKKNLTGGALTGSLLGETALFPKMLGVAEALRLSF